MGKKPQKLRKGEVLIAGKPALKCPKCGIYTVGTEKCGHCGRER